MNKTVSINLSGQVFQIDEQAYDKLKNYLDSIRRRFTVSEGGQEIIADIESRISELFSEKLNFKKQVITLADVDDIITLMGKPEEFETEEIDNDFSDEKKKLKRRLFRNPDDKVVSGVCSGISAYLGVEDPLWVRLIFLTSLLFSFGTTLFIYIIMVIIVPEAKNASEKLQMRGEDINISNIEKTIKEDLTDLKDRLNNINAKDSAQRAKSVLENFASMLVGIVVFALKLVLKIFAVALIITGLAIVFSLLVAIAFPAYMDGFTLSSLYPLFFSSQLLVFIGLLGIVLIAGVPALAIAMLGFRLLLNNRRRIRGLGFSLSGLWLLGIGLVAFTAAKTAIDFRASETLRAELPLAQPAGDTLFLNSLDVPVPAQSEEYLFFDIGSFTQDNGEYLVAGRVKLDIKRSNSSEFQLMQEIKSKGRNRKIAIDNASSVVYKTSQTDSSLSVASVFSFPVNDHFRQQEVRLTLKIPEGKTIFLSEYISDILYDIQNVSDTYDRDMAGHVWTMLPAGLTCIDCDFAANKKSRFDVPKGKVSRQLDYDQFTGIESSGAFNIEIKQGSEYQISVVGDQRFVDNIEIEKKGDLLKINPRNKLNIFGKEKAGSVTVTLPELNHLKLTGANQAVLSGFKGGKMKLEIAGASEVEMKSSYERLDADIAGASTVVLTGTGSELVASIAGASSLKAFNYKTDKCKIDVSGASKAEVNVSGELKAEASGASEILYKGLPKISSDVSGFSSMKPSK